jgi:parallel beta-helix repeat protein
MMAHETLLGSGEPRINLRMATALILVMVVIGSNYQTPTYASSNNQQNTPTLANRMQIPNMSTFATEDGCTYLIFTDGTATFVQDCNTGVIVSSGTNAATQINNAIATLKNGGLIHVKAGTYTLTAPIVGTVDGVTFEGEGPDTVFNVKAEFSESIVVAEGSNWVLRNFKIDGTNQARIHSNAGIYTSGNNETIIGTEVFGTDHAGIEDGRYGCGGKCGYGIKILNNVITKGYDDGIIVDGSNVLVSGNIVDTTTNHNGISLVSPQNVSVVGNSINNTNCGIALENLGYGWGPAKFIIITGNMIRDSRFFGFWIFSGDGDSGDYVTFNRNIIINPRTGGIELDSGIHNLISNNVVANSSARGIYVLGIAQFVTITGNKVISPNANGIWMSTAAHDCVVDNNTITNSTGNGILLAENSRVTVTGNQIYYPTYIAGIEVEGGNDITIRSNHVRVSGANRTGIDLLGVSSFTITDNTITGSGLSGGSQLTAGIMATNSTLGLIASNVILGDTLSGILLENESRTAVLGNSVTLAVNCILESTNGSDYNILSDNVLNNCSTGLSYIGTHDTATNNTGFNHGTIQSSTMTIQNQVATSGPLTQEFVLGSAIVIAAALCVALLTKIKHRQPKKKTTRRKVTPRHNARKNR